MTAGVQALAGERLSALPARAAHEPPEGGTPAIPLSPPTLLPRERGRHMNSRLRLLLDDRSAIILRQRGKAALGLRGPPPTRPTSTERCAFSLCHPNNRNSALRADNKSAPISNFFRNFFQGPSRSGFPARQRIGATWAPLNPSSPPRRAVSRPVTSGRTGGARR